MYVPKYLNFKQERIIGEHTIILPDPPNIRKIANRDKAQFKQKFYKTELPNDFHKWDKNKLTSEQEEFIANEWDKRLNGYWFMNNGRLEYLTGVHYFYLNWWKVDGESPIFTDADRDFFYLWDYVDKHPKCIGLYYVTGRRTGKSHKSACILYEKISRSSNAQGAMQSINTEVVKELYAKLIGGWRELPFFFKPIDTGETNPSKSLRFFESSKRSLKTDEKVYGKVLNSQIFYAPSGEVALEGRKLQMIIHDEIAKTEKVDIYKRFYVSSVCCIIPKNKIVGKILCTTTVEELKNTDNWNKAKELWDDSELATDPKVSKFRISQSRMIRYFQPADYGSFETTVETDNGKVLDGVDEYGYSRRELVRNYMLEERETMSGFVLKEERMKFPLDLSDAWQGTTSTFYDSNLLELAYNEAVANEEHQVRRVTFFEKPDGTVDFKDDPNGFWHICWDFKNKSESNRIQYDYNSGRIKLLNYMKFSIACDPFGKSGEVKNGSNAAIAVKLEYDVNYEQDSNTYICQYVGRRRTIGELAKDLIMTCKYYGTKALVEDDQNALVNYILDRPHWSPYLASAGRHSVDLSKNRGHISLEDKRKMLAIGAKSKNPYALEQCKIFSQEYVQEYSHKLKIPVLINDLIKYDDEKRGNHDISVSFQWCEFESANKYKVKETGLKQAQNITYNSKPIFSNYKYTTR